LPAWQEGVGVFGYQGYPWSAISTPLSAPAFQVRAYYFKTKFRVTNSRCYSALLMNFILKDGVVVYLNNVEILRANMPAGNISNTTAPKGRRGVNEKIGYQYSISSYSLTKGAASLVEGSTIWQ